MRRTVPSRLFWPRCRRHDYAQSSATLTEDEHDAIESAEDDAPAE